MALMLFAPETVVEAVTNRDEEQAQAVRIEHWGKRLEALEQAVEAKVANAQ